MHGNKTGFDIFVDSFSPKMRFEVDVFWVKLGGIEPTISSKTEQPNHPTPFEGFKERVGLSKFGKIEPEAFDEIGDGMIPIIPIMRLAQKLGIKHCHVEQDHSLLQFKAFRKVLIFLKISETIPLFSFCPQH